LIEAARCPQRFCGGLLEQHVAAGRRVEVCAQCDRRRRGLCRDCPKPVYGMVGRAIRCAACAKRRHNRQNAEWNREPAVRLRRNKRHRRYAKQPAIRERRRKGAREWRRKNPAKVRASKRRFLLSEGPARVRYLDYQTKYNARPARAQAKRDAALAKYYALHPVRPDPHCTGCGVAIEWTPGHGRPRRTCNECCDPRERRRRERGDNLNRSKRRRVA
jgi:hypothetical protein